MKTYKFSKSHVFEHLLHRLVFPAAMVLMTLPTYSAMGADWLTLDPSTKVPPLKWDWQLAVPVKANPDTSIKIYDIEMFQNEKTSTVQMLHAKGYKVICYIDVGSWENWRDDKNAFLPTLQSPDKIIGTKYSGFPDENWLDIRDVFRTNGKLGGILKKRFERAKAMGCDAVEPDNMDGYDTTAHESSGFPLTYKDQYDFNLWVADQVHLLGMKVGLKNDINQAKDPAFVATFDFVVSEQCFQYNECGYFSDFLNANKPVFEAEYGLVLTKFCPKAKPLRISAIKKRNSLNTTRSDCSAYYP
jgi:hypothetical protein